MPLDLTKLLDTVDAGLNGVSESMLKADLLLLEHSRVVLKQLVENLTEVKAAVSSGRSNGVDETRVRLEKLRSKLKRLQAIGDAADFAIRLRAQSAGVSQSGYTARGISNLESDFRTLSMDY